jgi:hypothetical protein
MRRRCNPGIVHEVTIRHRHTLCIYQCATTFLHMVFGSEKKIIFPMEKVSFYIFKEHEHMLSGDHRGDQNNV